MTNENKNELFTKLIETIINSDLSNKDKVEITKYLKNMILKEKELDVIDIKRDTKIYRR